MAQLHCYVPEPIPRKLHERAEAAGVSTSRYLAELIRRDVGVGWPEDFFETIVGGWKGEELVRPSQPVIENRDSFSD